MFRAVGFILLHICITMQTFAVAHEITDEELRQKMAEFHSHVTALQLPTSREADFYVERCECNSNTWFKVMEDCQEEYPAQSGQMVRVPHARLLMHGPTDFHFQLAAPTVSGVTQMAATVENDAFVIWKGWGAYTNRLFSDNEERNARRQTMSNFLERLSLVLFAVEQS